MKEKKLMTEYLILYDTFKLKIVHAKDMAHAIRISKLEVKGNVMVCVALSDIERIN